MSEPKLEWVPAYPVLDAAGKAIDVTVAGSPRQPTADECSNNTEIEPGRFAIWYPQMGGYVGRAVIEEDDGGFNAWVWHDGEFPFENGFEPRMLHHCEAAQFVRFGRDVQALLGLEE